MPHDEALARRVRDALASAKGLGERKMFGGIAFLIDGAMCVGVDKKDLILRCEKEETESLLARPGARAFDLSGNRPMRGWLLVGPEATSTPAELQAWIDLALEWTKRNAKSSGDGRGAKSVVPAKKAASKSRSGKK